MTNLDLWNKVCETDPKHTKPVTFGRGFTAIDPMYQIRNATEQFGPVGQGWGWNVKNVHYPMNGSVVVHIRIWHGDGVHGFDEFGEASTTMKDRPDTDCHKKALTDAITKGLSRLGFNADVFFGKFDDNKYVAEMRAKHSEAPPLKPEPSEATAEDIGKTPVEWMHERLENTKGFVDACAVNARTMDLFKARCKKIGDDSIFGKLNQDSVDYCNKTLDKLEESLINKINKHKEGK